MEHKLSQGGEQFLPFARSRIKALRATGLKYASQQFELDGVSVKVRIGGEHEYITLSGGTLNCLSGVTKDASVVTLPVVPPASVGKKTLRSFKPTAQAWQYQQKKDATKSPTVFGDEDRFGFATTQYEAAAPTSGSQYSGLMAKAVQLMLGVGVTSGTPEGLIVPYSYAWNRTHAITKAVDGKLWLVEISSINGVIAMPFEVRKGGSASSPQDMVREAVKWFKGLPVGTTFPEDANIDAAIAAGSVIRLAAASSLAPFYSKQAYASWVGWSLNNSGSQAHNTCWDIVSGITTSYHYKLEITIGATVVPTAPNQPIATGSAALTMESSGVVWEYYSLLSGTPYTYPMPYGFGNPTTGVVVAIPPGQRTYDGAWTKPDGSALPVLKFPVFACHINDTLDVVYIRSDLEVTSGGGTGSPGDFSLNDATGYYVDSNSFPGRPGRFYVAYGAGGAISGYSERKGDLITFLSSSVMFPGMDRDSYMRFQSGGYSYGPSGIDYSTKTPSTVSVVHRNGHIYSRTLTGWLPAPYAGPSEWGFGELAWGNPGLILAYCYSISSALGDTEENTHMAFTLSAARTMNTPGLVLKGHEVSGEVSPSLHKYNFLGYV